MLPSPPLTAPEAASVEQLPDQLLEVVAELTEIVREENEMMANGVPAGLVHTLDRKIGLAEEYEELCERIREEREDGLMLHPELTQKLTAAVLLLRDATAENLERLEAAMDASKRRVEAVMAAIRSEAKTSAPYGADGGVPLAARLAAFGKDFHC